jgi:hypothetical protein
VVTLNNLAQVCLLRPFPKRDVRFHQKGAASSAPYASS